LPGEATDFGVLLKRLSDRRQLDIGSLPRLADVTEREVQALFDGGEPSAAVLRRLAPVVGLHTADLFVIADVAVPDDLTPTDERAGRLVPDLVRHAVRLSPEKRNSLRRLVASLPQEERAQPAPRLPPYEDYPAGPGAMLMRMLRNRNLGWVGTAKTFLPITRRYWSAATYGCVGRGSTELTTELLIDFAAVLGIPAADLAALTGVVLSGVPSVPEPAVGTAELIWDVRRLTADQLLRVGAIAESMR
jgi:hypothetical protein